VTTEVLFIGGRSGVGKSSVAHELFRQLSEADVMHCLIEGDNLDLAHPTPWKLGHQLAEQNLAAMWSNYRALGHSRLIYVNTAAVRPDVIASLTTAMGDEPNAHGVLLTAADETIEARLAQRETGTALQEHLDRSRAAKAALDGTAPPWVRRVATDGRSLSEIAAEIARSLSGWGQDATPIAPDLSQ